MSAPSYFVKVLSAAVKVLRRAEDGTPQMRTAGLHPATGEPLLVPDTRTVILQKGDPLPDNVIDGEIERLQSLDPPAIGAKAAVSVMSAPAATTGKSTPKRSSAKKKSTAKKSTAKKKTTASSSGRSATSKAPVVDLSKLAELGDQELVAALQSNGVKKLVAAIGSDAALAQRALDAEKAAAQGDPRKSLVDALEKLVAGGAGGSSES